MCSQGRYAIIPSGRRQHGRRKPLFSIDIWGYIVAGPTSSTGKFSKGRNSAERILQHATDVLIDSGYHNFSLRKVASAAGVRLGHLQYYFPTKAKLVEAMLDRTIQAYLDEFERIRVEGGTPHEQFYAIIRSVITDLGTRQTTVFFPELWSLANHETGIDNLMDTMYGKYRNVLRDIVRDVNPDLSENQAARLALFMSSSMEGHTMFIGHQKPWNAEIEHFVDMSIRSFLWLVESGRIPDVPLTPYKNQN